jgi:hypothetical protein
VTALLKLPPREARRRGASSQRPFDRLAQLRVQVLDLVVLIGRQSSQSLTIASPSAVLLIPRNGAGA